MAVVKTVKPLGGGDFASLQSWWDWAKTQSAADQWAECYGGGSLGFLNATGGHAFTPDASNYPRIYAAAGHQHNMTWDTAKAHIDGGATTGVALVNMPVNHAIVEGLQVKASGNCTGLAAYTGMDAGPFYYRDLLVIGTDEAGTNAVSGVFAYVRNNEVNGYVENCVFYNCGEAGISATAVGANWYILNCGVVDCGNYSGASAGIVNTTADIGHKLYMWNTYVLNNGSRPCLKHSFYPGTYDIRSCFVSDSSITGNGYAATDCVEGVSTAGQVEDYDGDWRTVSESDFVGAGEDLSAVFTTDAVGHVRTTPWWVGPWQAVEEGEAVFKAFWAVGSNPILGRK
jgi:hypothetical protein